MIKVVEFCTRVYSNPKRAAEQLEEYISKNCIKREEIISITSNQRADISCGDTIMLVYEDGF